MEGALYNSIKEYPNMIQIIIYKNPSRFPIVEGFKARRRPDEVDDDYMTLERSVRRSRVQIRDLIFCNNFDYFCTFTFNPKKYDRYNFNNLKLVMTRWLNNQRRLNSPNLKYIVIPEFHKDGAIHFHALLKNYNGPVKETGKRTKGNYKIFNLPSFRGGFTTASPIDENLDAISEYVSKYITKDMIKIFNKNRYFCSQGLIRPKKYHNKAFWLPNIKHKKKIHETIDYETYLVENNIDNRDLLMIN